MPWIRSGALLLCLVALIGSPTTDLWAQMPPLRNTPNVDLTDASYVRTIVRLPSGKLIVGGNDLQRVNGVAQPYMARLNADGSTDTTWNPAPNGPIGVLWIDGAGMLYVGGFFTSIAGQPRTNLARFDASGVLDPNFHPSVNNGVNAITPGLPGTVCIGGIFTQIGTATHHRLACLSDIDGSDVTTFVPDFDGTVVSLLTVGNAIYAGGFFANVGGVARYGAVRMSLSGTGAPDSWNPKANSTVYAFLPAGSGAIYLAGGFNSLNATARQAVAKVDDTTGAVIPAFNAQAPSLSDVFDLCSDGAGGLIVVGSFTAIGGQPSLNIARIDGTTGNAITGFDPSINYGYANHVLGISDGTYYVSGSYSSLGGGEHLSIGHVLANGSVDAAFNASLESQGYAYLIAQLPTPGEFVVAGRFSRAEGLIRRNLFKLSPPGRVDPNWIAHTNSEVRGLAVDDVGRIYISGYFTRVDNAVRTYLARLQNTSDGALDTAWNPAPNSAIYPILLRPEGLYIAGGFSSVGGGSQSSLARISTTTGNLDTGWKPTFTGGGIGALVGADAHSILISGAFTAVNGTSSAGLAKLRTGISGTLDASWTPSVAGGSVYSMAVDNSEVYLGGTFTAINAAPRAGLARLSVSGAGVLDAMWTPTATGATAVILPQPEGVYLGGYFSSLNGGGNGYLARVDKGTGATDTSWASYANTWVLSMLRYHESIMIAGWFTSVGGEIRQGVARLPAAGDTIYVDDFDG
jgi:uncharacterized delta-60 repeat protein